MSVDLTDIRIAFLGGGNMAEALIKGLLASSLGVAAQRIAVSDPAAARRAYLAETYGVTPHAANKAAMKGADMVFLAVKPQVIDEVLVEIQDEVAEGQVVVSVAAGVTVARIRGHLYADSKVVRAMPNTPCLVGAGASAVTPGPGVTPEELATVSAVFGAVGSVVAVAEEQMDAVTALSGSGPAYVFLMIEALADGGVKMGLSRETATALAAQTVLGAATMVRKTGTHPAGLKDMVTSPGGTTAAGLHVLEECAVRGALMSAVEAATERSRALGRGE
ncbi:MAG: pyrroline-5-carboxylate reductase [Nitrospirae bacterium]|nr:pyrroline-5-carboxylate reductase [Nitrospirota bacterium]